MVEKQARVQNTSLPPFGSVDVLVNIVRKYFSRFYMSQSTQHSSVIIFHDSVLSVKQVLNKNFRI